MQFDVGKNVVLDQQFTRFDEQVEDEARPIGEASMTPAAEARMGAFASR